MTYGAQTIVVSDYPDWIDDSILLIIGTSYERKPTEILYGGSDSDDEANKGKKPNKKGA